MSVVKIGSEEVQKHIYSMDKSNDMSMHGKSRLKLLSKQTTRKFLVDMKEN